MGDKKLFLNLGCGNDYKVANAEHEWRNWDMSREVKADAYLDAGKDAFPAVDGTFDEVHALSLFACILENSDFIHMLNECHRVLKSGGRLIVRVPNANYKIAFRDPIEVRRFMPDTFEYFIEGTKRYKNFGSVYGFKPWKLVSIRTRRFLGWYMWLQEFKLNRRFQNNLFGLPSIYKGNMTVVMQKP